ncbi:hypothetical protein H6G76_32920 [Nostoc sp. FACHB-152]|uniref:hypothetical protein n=1 Tax=Nostoc sp. FACHB-152 TaxID=2692837 RepID=UPI001683C741|nr:hypothetical protein [Nostoc sp. FACHB-152]MBD2451840.1 hypothetical protein [Nostoc sp. FACHB-152]
MSNLPAISKLLQDNPALLTTEGLSALLEDCICLKYPSHHKFTYPSLLNRDIYLALAELGNGSTQDEEMIRRIMADPKGWCIDAPADVQQGAKFYERLGKMFDADFSTDLFVYHRVRDNIHQLQHKLGISGVSDRNVSMRDRLFSYPAAEDQLILLVVHQGNFAG